MTMIAYISIQVEEFCLTWSLVGGDQVGSVFRRGTLSCQTKGTADQLRTAVARCDHCDFESREHDFNEL